MPNHLVRILGKSLLFSFSFLFLKRDEKEKEGACP
jgi:hypothetical protein